MFHGQQLFQCFSLQNFRVFEQHLRPQKDRYLGLDPIGIAGWNSIDHHHLDIMSFQCSSEVKVLKAAKYTDGSCALRA
jgi:hypothetical protein